MMLRLSLVLWAFVFASCSSTEKNTSRPNTSSPKKAPPSVVKTPSPSQPTSATAVTPQAGAQPPVSSEEARLKALALEQEQSGKIAEAIRSYVSLSVSAVQKKDQDDARQRAISLVDARLNEDDLQNIARDSEYGYVRGYALFRLGELSLQRFEKESARKYFTSVVEILPESNVAQQSQEVIAQLDASKRVQPKTIGAILPLSGKNSAIGQRALRGIQMGLGLHQPYSNFKLAVMDSEGNPDLARRGVERLIVEDNVIAIVGGLLAKTASAEISKANEYEVPFIFLSQKSGLNELSPTVFRNSLTMDMQIRHLVRHSMDVLKMKRFAILFPNDSYGVENANIFWDEVLARGGTVAGAQSYNPKDNDFRWPIQRLVGTFYVEARLDEYRQKQKDFFQNNKKSRQNYNPEDLLTPIVDFDAIFIPDSAKVLGQVAAFLSYSGVKSTRLLGTNLWNSPGLGKRLVNLPHEIYFVDSFFPSQMSSNRFFTEYHSLFNEDSSLIEAQAYDAALIFRQLILQGSTSREDILSELLRLKDFPGVLGPLNMTSKKEVRRPLLSLTLDKSGEIIPVRN